MATVRVRTIPQRLAATASSRVVAELSLATTAMASYNFALLGILALTPSFRRTLALDAAQIGVVAATPFVTAAASTFAAARLTDRLGAGTAVGLSQLAIVAACAVVGTAPSFPLLLLGVAVLGIGSGLVNPATNVLAAGIVPAHRRGIAMSLKQSGVTIGGAIAGLTVPAFAVATSWRVALVLPATAAGLVAVWGFRAVSSAPARPLVLDASGVRTVRRRRTALYGFAMSGAQLAVFGYLALYLVDARGLTVAAAGRGLAVTLAAGGVGRLCWGLALDRGRSRGGVLLTVSVGSALAFAAVPAVAGPLVWLDLAAVGFCAVGWNGVYHAVIAESAGSGGVARATSFALLFLYAGAIAIPPSLGLVVQHVSWRAFWLLAAVIAAGAGAVVAERRRDRASRQVSTQS